MTSWWHRLKQGLKKSTNRLNEGLKSILVKRKLDQDTLDSLEDLLIINDLGTNTAQDFISKLKKERFNQDIDLKEVKLWLQNQIEDTLKPFAQEISFHSSNKPFVVLVVGINGSGKTTTIAKLAHQWKNAGKQVSVVAGDTFRAAAVEQLSIWANRLGITVHATKQNGDPAALVYDAYQKSTQANDDILIIDTAGRLHNKSHLMAELEKIHRILKKCDSHLPHETILVLDATLGQNAITQAQSFHQTVKLSGLIMTKLDGSAKGGVLVPLTQQLKLPIYALCVGESVEDLKNFDATMYAQHLVGLEDDQEVESYD